MPLEPYELTSLTERMVSDMHDLEAMETEFAALKKERSTAIKDLKASIARTRRTAYLRAEDRTVPDCVQVYDTARRLTWFEYRGQKYDETGISEFELRSLVNPPLFPAHDAATGELDEDEAETDDPFDLPPPVTEPLPGNVSDIEDVRRSEAKRNKHDHTA